MRCIPDNRTAGRCVGCRRLWLWSTLLALATLGCHSKPQSAEGVKVQPPTVHLTRPALRHIVRVIGQPSFIEPYERTSIFPKMTGFIEKWNVDIGDKVKAGDVLATLFVPELVEDFGTKKATVKVDQERIELALTVVQVAEANVTAAVAGVAEAKAILGKYQADMDRWKSEVARLTIEVKNGVVAPQVLLESQNQWKANIAARDAASATIVKSDAELLSKQSSLSRAKADVSVARPTWP